MTRVDGPKCSAARSGLDWKEAMSVSKRAAVAEAAPLASGDFPWTEDWREFSWLRLATSRLKDDAIPAVRRVNGLAVEVFSRSVLMNASDGAPWFTNTRPGLVQNWPAPSVKEVKRSPAIFSPRAASAPGRMKSGLVLAISP